MTKAEVIRLLESNQNERGIANWKKIDPSKGKWSSYGIGLTQLKKLAKKIGKNHALAAELWKTDNYDCKTMSILVDDPHAVTEEQIEKQVDEICSWIMSHTYCSTLLPRVPFIQRKAEEWADSKEDKRRRCGYLVLCQAAKDNKQLDDAYFEPYIATIEDRLQSEENFVKDAMNNALWYIGMRSAGLNRRAVEAAKKIGKVEIDYGDNSCQAIDVLKHLSGDAVKRKLGLK